MYDQITVDLQRENAELRTKLGAAEKSRDKALSDLDAKCDQYAAAAQCVSQLERQNEKWRDRAEAAEKALAEANNEVVCISRGRDSWAAQSREHNIARIKAADALAVAAEDTALLDWLSCCKYGAWGPEMFAGELAAQVQLETRGDAWKGDTLRAAIRAALKVGK